MSNKQYAFISFWMYLFIISVVGSFCFSQDMSSKHFIEMPADLPGIEKNMRKWDAPVLADLDQDGFVDLVLNDHGYSVMICWNNKGHFAKPYELIMGDMHGIAVGDFDFDDNQEIVIARGGGAGSNARNAKIFKVDRQRNIYVMKLNHPLERMRGRTVKFVEADNDGDLDLLNFAFPSAEKKGKTENYIYENQGNGIFRIASFLPPSKRNGQKTLITDFNNDGIFDLLIYGHKRVKAFQGKGDLTFQEVTDKIFPFNIMDVTGIIEFDFDNDGDFDLFFTRGSEFEIGETFYDKTTKRFGFFSKRGRFQPKDLIIGDVLNIENFHTQWPHKNIYLGESAYIYEFPGETHSGKNLRIVNSDALGFPDKIEKKGTFIGFVGNQAWRIITDTWGPITMVIHGV
ncbi:MAG: VCBS repeat-containing protein, partial [Caldisericaceae bacterium]|nr:VCBS repeat-containing protein [Caldisericaceae bacterium]